ncbi:MAG: ABC transporter ATP-binding protein [Planctomycetota bacterium]
MNEPVLRASGVRKSFTMGGETLHVLQGVDIEVRAGDMISIVGASGAGKSTLLHILGLLDRPTEGEVYYGDRPLARESATERARVRRTHVSFVFQFYHLIPELNALENVLLSRMMDCSIVGWRSRRAGERERAAEVLAAVGLQARLRHRPHQLSGGERQRVAIARALISRPWAVLCDEPTGNLDERTSRGIEDLLFELNRQGQTMIVVTHNEALARRTQRTLVLEGGQLHPKQWGVSHERA